MKKLISIALAIMLIMSLATVAFATGTNPGSIKITASADGHTYTIYKIFDLTVDDPTNPTAFVYTVNSDWAGFFAADATPATGALDYVNIDASTGAVTWKNVDADGNANDEDVAAFAKLALAYAKKNGITSKGSVDGNGTDQTIDNLPLGYYLVDSTMGALVSLTTTAPNATVSEKNSTPSVDKTVKEGEAWVESNSAKVGDVVEFCATITVQKGAEGYVLHDKMTAGLTFQSVSKVTVLVDDVVDPSNYTVNTSTTDGCTFEVKFDDTYVASLAAGTNIKVYYSAVLNEQAIVTDNGTSENEVILDFGDENNTTNDRPTDKTETKTYDMDVTKTDNAGNVLSGAEFKVYDQATGGNEIAMVKVSDGVYRVKYAGETAEAVSIVIPENGTVTLKGFDLDKTYYLEETVAPDGYNKLTARQAFKIEAGADTTAEIDNGVYKGGGVQVINNKGEQLPTTGAMGTAIFVSFGTMVVLGTGVLLITKKRMSMIED